MTDQAILSRCPLSTQDSRKSAAVAQAGGGVAGMRVVRDFAEARGLLRNPDARQAGFLADLVNKVSLTRAPILYQHGAEHRRQRGATARFFAPRVVTTAYRALMEQTSDELVGRFSTTGSADLDELGLEMAVTIAAEIAGLTDSDRRGMAKRLGALVSGMPRGGSRLATILGFARGQARSLNFLLRDVKPAIASRRKQRREDVISHLLDQGYSEREILTECLTYGAAGMITTREFITMAGWHLLENDDLRGRFLEGDEASQIAILEEILRLEPVVGVLFRRLDADATVVALDVRGANADETAVGACPYSLDPERKLADKVGRAGLAFGDGEHRCPGAQVALQEAAIFLDRLLRVPGVRLERAPDIGWNALIAGYELRRARLACGAAVS
ncbi:cytochrome P450 [Sphingomonas mucosissima]|uniref:Cytochrome P450 107B1 n=1 Tax=Sphingomonas mucosissima TaxID=370959 RepID=A0A245ZRU4_9SPHN|nr:cytochrome P450 [Sphingomonas mucosissima]OWK32465.1 cytochrome P450 107B1 [Sphingomonas mucosissima]